MKNSWLLVFIMLFFSCKKKGEQGNAPVLNVAEMTFNGKMASNVKVLNACMQPIGPFSGMCYSVNIGYNDTSSLYLLFRPIVGSRLTGGDTLNAYAQKSGNIYYECTSKSVFLSAFHDKVSYATYSGYFTVEGIDIENNNAPVKLEGKFENVLLEK